MLPVFFVFPVNKDHQYTCLLQRCTLAWVNRRYTMWKRV